MLDLVYEEPMYILVVVPSVDTPPTFMTFPVGNVRNTYNVGGMTYMNISGCPSRYRSSNTSY
eukprot:SAG11_NODE_35719_length_265_cov_0.855422_1_plen_62_part_01